MAWQPETGVLWTVVNERDELGSDLVPDYLTSVKDVADDVGNAVWRVGSAPAKAAMGN